MEVKMRDMTNASTEQAKQNGWNIIKELNCEVVGKAILDNSEINSEGKSILIKIMKSTKRFKVEGGWIYNTSTEYHKGDQISIAEALVFVPKAIIGKPLVSLGYSTKKQITKEKLKKK